MGIEHVGLRCTQPNLREVEGAPCLVFARHVARVDPDSAGWVIDDRNWVLGGPLATRFEVPEVWLHAEDWPRAGVMLAALCERLGSGFSVAMANFPDEAPPVFEGYTHATDLHFVRDAVIAPRTGSAFEAVRLDLATLSALAMDDDMRRVVGRPDDLARDFGGLDWFYGVVHAGRLIGLAEATVQDEATAAIQQVYAAEAWRGRGVGRAVVMGVANAIFRVRKRALYVCDARNAASAALARGLGFRLYGTYCNFSRV